MKHKLNFLALFVFSALSFNSAADSTVPEENKQLIPIKLPPSIYYEIGGGNVLAPPKYNKSKFRFKDSIELNGTMMCNKFDPSISMGNLLNGVKKGWATTQRNMVNSVKGVLASAPMLVIQNQWPGLYDYMQEGMAAAEDTFNIEVANCTKITNDLKDGNLNNDWIKVSGYEKYIDYFTSRDGAPAPVENADAGEMVKDAEKSMGKEGLTWVCGQKRGGTGQPAIKMSEVIIASYNRMIDRGNCEGLAPVSSSVNPAFVKYWKTPAKAQSWFVDVFGETMFRTDPDAKPVESKPGAGLMMMIDDTSTELQEQLTELVQSVKDGNEVTLNELRAVSAPGFLISREVVNALANNPSSQLLIGRVATELAVQREVTKALEMRRLVVAAKNINEVMKNPEALSIVKDYEERMMDEILMVKQEIEIRRSISTSTIPTILDFNNSKLNRATLR